MPFWQFFKNRPIGLIGMPCWFSPPKPPTGSFFSYTYILIFIYWFECEIIVRNSAPSFGHSYTNPSSVNRSKWRRNIFKFWGLVIRQQNLIGVLCLIFKARFRRSNWLYGFHLSMPLIFITIISLYNIYDCICNISSQFLNKLKKSK